MFAFKDLSYLNSDPGLKSAIKSRCEDFIVEEMMQIELDGAGEHSWLHIRKTATNTEEVAKQLANFAAVNSKAVSYAGLKDKHAVTTQWFSVHLPGKPDPDWAQLENSQLDIIEIKRHSRKLKRGALKGNKFTLRLTECQGEKQNWLDRLQLISAHGVPNYFGPQRFGIQMNNLTRAGDLVEHNKLRRLKPHKRGIYLSAMRSWIFNRIVSQRIEQGSYFEPLTGDVFMLAESNACFAEAVSADIIERLKRREIHLTAALWGRGRSMASAAVEQLEAQVARETPLFVEAIEKAGMQQERRAMRLTPVNMQWQFKADNSLVVSFELIKGSYATAILRELGDITDASVQAR